MTLSSPFDAAAKILINRVYLYILSAIRNLSKAKRTHKSELVDKEREREREKVDGS